MHGYLPVDTSEEFFVPIRRDLVSGHLSLRLRAVATPLYPGGTTLKLTSHR